MPTLPAIEPSKTTSANSPPTPEAPSWERLFELFASELSNAKEASAAGKQEEAQEYLQRVVQALSREQDLAALEAGFLALYKENPHHTGALNFFAMLHVLGGDIEKGAAAWRKSISINPRQPAILFNLGCISESLWRLEDAIAAFTQRLQLTPDHIASYACLAHCYTCLGQMKEATEVLDTALKQWPDVAPLLTQRISCHMTLGEKEQGAALCRYAIGLYPKMGEYFLFLTKLEKPDLQDPLVKQAERGWRDTRLSLPERSMFGFGLYRVYEAAGRHREAFKFLKAANQLQHARLEFDPEAVRARTEAITSLTPAPVRPKSLCVKSLQGQVIPIFIVGLPRSGTSLVEQILASHSHIHGAGELDYLQRVAFTGMLQMTGMPWPDCLSCLEDLNAEQVARLRGYYLTRLRAHNSTTPFITDKLPGNYSCIALIRGLFPRARIIHCKRDPLATCFSIYRQNFKATHNYAYDFKALATVWKEYDGLMQHWKNLHGEAIYEVSYEALVNDLQGAVACWSMLAWSGKRRACDFMKGAEPVPSAPCRSRNRFIKPPFSPGNHMKKSSRS